MPQRAPNTPAVQPTIGAPSGVPPMKHMRYSAMTRPRIVGSTPSCTDAFAAVVNVSIAHPAGTSMRAVDANPGIDPAATSINPNAVAAPTRNSDDGRRVRRVARIAPTQAPTASAVDSNP